MANSTAPTRDVSVIIVSWNTCAVTRDCLRSVFDQTRGIDFEVIVVDNASRDGSAEMVRREFPEAVLIENRENRGFAAANNQAMRLARGKYVLLLNSDTVLIDGAIQKSYAFIEKRPEAGVVGCKARNEDGSLQYTCLMFPGLVNQLLLAAGLSRAFPNNRFFGRAEMTWWDHGEVREVDYVAGCFMLVRRAAIEQAGMMDEKYFMYAEEADWCLRLRRTGWKVFYYPGAEYYHLLGASEKSSVRDMTLERRKSLLCFFNKNFGPPKAYAANFIFILNDALRIVPWVIGCVRDALRGRPDLRRQLKLASCLKTLAFHLFGPR